MHYEKFQDGSVKCIEDEIPFEVPEGWAWCRISSICIINPRNQLDDNTDVSFVSMPCICGGYDNSHTSDIRKWRKVKTGYTHFQENDIGIAKITPCFENRKSVIFKNLINGSGAGTTELHILRTVKQFVSEKYLFYIFKTDNFISSGITAFTGAVGQKRIGTTFIANYMVPLPPYKEQIVIVESIAKIFDLITTIDVKKAKIKDEINITKSKILNLAIRGKLVPQDLTDESASALLERIRAEKEELIKQGKIKRDKNASVIFKGDDNSYYEKMGNKVTCINEEIPFELPKNWMFVRLKNIWQLLSGRDLAPSDYNSIGNGIPYITGASNFFNGTVSISRWTASPQVVSETGDLLLTCKGTVGEMAFNDFGNAHIARQIMAIRNIYNLDSEYMALCIKYYFDTLVISAKGLIPGISREDILNLILPIPPQQYQNRLVLQMKEIDKAVASAQGYIS